MPLLGRQSAKYANRIAPWNQYKLTQKCVGTQIGTQHIQLNTPTHHTICTAHRVHFYIYSTLIPDFFSNPFCATYLQTQHKWISNI